ncbi:TRAP transporter small permease subunit [Curvibacter sp. HBC61]|uniref:TRAP transporter small permease protein n=1 Tax=Curvibacter cyanobacteriorum TaxID=3026422 RepID=A0ABT5MXE2_9BURK|nr:TRAP transporter small permease subunit [Curvibacter sp. HBC61]MDD0838565.1 TRAP transporter small permease subunit [Curvibacter sp. HBC61]
MFRRLESISRHAMTVAGWCYLLITVLICFDIGARRLLGFSTEATTELTGYLMAIGMSWGLAGTLFDRGHVRIDVLVQKLPLQVRVWLHLLSLGALLVASLFFVYGALSLAKDSWDFGATDLSTLRMPMVIPQGLWAAGLVLLLLTGVALLARALRQLSTGQADAMDRMLMARTYEDEAAETLEAVSEAQAQMSPPVAAAAPLATPATRPVGAPK